MEFRKRADVIGCCIRLHNYCLEERIDIEEETLMVNGIIELVPGRSITASIVKQDDITVDSMSKDRRCHYCGSSTRASSKTDERRQAQLEQAIKEKGLKRPYRRP